MAQDEGQYIGGQQQQQQQQQCYRPASQPPFQVVVSLVNLKGRRLLGQALCVGHVGILGILVPLLLRSQQDEAITGCALL